MESHAMEWAADAIERQLVAYQRLLPTIDDAFALALMADLVKDVQSEGAALHADHPKNGGETGQPQLAASSIPISPLSPARRRCPLSRRC
jgi:hypothetical protein